MKTIRAIGLPITIFNSDDIEKNISDNICNSKTQSFHGYSIDTLYLMKNIPNLFQMREMNDYFLCDGRGYYYFMRLLGIKGVKKLSLPSLTMFFIRFASIQNKSIYLLGASEKSNLNAQEILKTKYGVKSIFGRNGYYSSLEEESIVSSINSFSPDILLLGMSSPKKDEFVYKWKNVLNAKVIIHCGGMIDVISEKTKLYPKWVKDLCLAGVYRFIQEPLRLRRDIANALRSIFIILNILVQTRIFNKSYDFPRKHKLK